MTKDVRSALIVVTHPVSGSLSHTITNRIGEEFAGRGNNVDVADLHAEGFSPAMTVHDIALYRGGGESAPEILREQKRVEKADVLVFVFPVYWWSVPSMLKGWFERVLNGGWAYRVDENGRIVGNMRDVPVLLVATAAGDESGYQRHGYSQAIQNQVVEGVFKYSGLKDTQIAYFYDSDNATAVRIDEFVQTAVSMLANKLLRSEEK